jgi:GMP synthase-like glutamine amidotransferase
VAKPKILVCSFWRLSCFQYSHLITRRCREHNVYAELMPCTTLIKDVKFKPKGLEIFPFFSSFFVYAGL